MERRTATTAWGWYLLLLLPFIAMLWVSSYAGTPPELAGIPFFYWYQFLWVLIAAVLTAVVYFATREPEVNNETPAETADRELA
jgi:hypothetical protein